MAVDASAPAAENYEEVPENPFGRYPFYFSRYFRSLASTSEVLCDMKSVNVVLYTRQGCHLCDDALAVLRKFGLSPRIIDIDSDPQLVARYDSCVPVVEIDGQERFRGHVNEVLLKRLLAGS